MSAVSSETENGSFHALRVLSVQTAILGHKTYGERLRHHFQNVPDCQVDSVWQNLDREWSARLLVRLLTRNLPGGWAEARNMDLRRWRAELGTAYLARRLVVRHLERTPYQCLHFHTQVGALLCGDVMRRVPSVLTGDMTLAQVIQADTHPAWAWTYRPSESLDRAAFQAAARIAPWSEWAARSIITDYEIDPQKVEVINPGVDLSGFGWVKPRPQSPAGPVKLLFVGNDFTRKGGEDVLDVFLQRFSTRAELHLVTGAPITVSHPRVRVHQGVSAYSAQWQELYQSADIFVLPTHFDALGLVFMEAMAAGLPVVGSRINAVPEMVVEGETGLLIAPGDRQALAHSLETLIDNAALRNRMGGAGRERIVCHFDAHTAFQRLEALFRSAAIDGKGHRK